MKCRNCGKELGDNLKFCPKCGTKVEKAEEANTEAQEFTAAPECTDAAELGRQTPPPVKRAGFGGDFASRFDSKTKLILVFVAIGVVLLLVKIMKPKITKINPEHYLSVSCSGFNGEGTAALVFDRNRFDADYEKLYGKDAKDELNGGEYPANLPYVTARIEPSVGLANGDEIHVTYEYDNKAAKKMWLKYKDDGFTQRVEGLPEIPVLNMEDYCSAAFSGFNTMGIADIRVDDDAMKRFLEENGCEIPWGGVADLYDGAVSQRENLSNGDKVTVSFSFDQGLMEMSKVRMTGDGITYTVSGLTELKEIDPFEGVELSYENIAPFADAYINKDNFSKIQKELSYYIEDKDNVDLGEELLVYIDDESVQKLKENGYVPTTTQKTYTVSNVAQYIRDPEMLSEDGLNYLKKEAEDMLETHFAENAETILAKDGKYMGALALSSKSGNDQPYNKVVLIYSMNVESPDKTIAKELFFVVSFRKLVQNPEGDLYFGESRLAGTGDAFGTGTTYGFKSLEDIRMRSIAPDKAKYNLATGEGLEALGGSLLTDDTKESEDQ